MNRLKNNENCRLLLKILIIFAISRLIMLIMVPVYNGIMGTHRSFLFLMNEWDAKEICLYNQSWLYTPYGY